MSTLKITVIDDETVLYTIDDKRIIESGHGPHGWEGMTDIDAAMREVAHVLGLDIVLDETQGEMPI